MSDLPTKSAPDESPLIDCDEFARLLSCSRRHVQKLDVKGRLGPRGIKLGRLLRFKRSEVLAWIEADCPPRSQWLALQAGTGLRRIGGGR